MSKHHREQVWSTALDAAICESGLPETKLAERLGCNRKALRRYRDKEHTAQLPVAILAGLPSEVRRPLIEQLAELEGCRLAEVPDLADVAGDVRTCGAAAKECGEVVTAYGEALADGHLTAREAEGVRREIREAIAVLLAADARLAVVERERVVGVRV